MYCTNCGRELAEDAKFCPHCGDVVDEKERGQSDEQAAEATPEQPAPERPAEPGAPPVPAYQPTVPEITAAVPPIPPPVQPPAPEPLPPAPSIPQAVPPPIVQPSPVPPPVAQPTPAPTAGPVPPPVAQPTAPVMAAPPAAEPPPPQYAPPPPVQPPYAGAVPPPGEAPTKGGGKCWLIGCIVLLVLGIIIAVVGTFVCRRAITAAGNTLQNIETTTNGLDIWEPGEGAPSNAGDIVGRLGEAVEGLGQIAAGAGITGFNPSDVDPAMLGPFYGFMGALAADDPNAMHQFMSPSLKESWDPNDWTLSTGWKHMSYTLVSLEKPDADSADFEITEVIREEDSGEQQTLTWVVEMVKADGTWAVDDFGQPSEE